MSLVKAEREDESWLWQVMTWPDEHPHARVRSCGCPRVWAGGFDGVRVVFRDAPPGPLHRGAWRYEWTPALIAGFW